MRTTMLLIFVWLAAVGPSRVLGQEAGEFLMVDSDSVAAYLNLCRKPNGGFGPADQEYTDAAWNYPAVHALQLLGTPISRPQLVLSHGLDSPPRHVGYGHWRFFHEHQIPALLKEPLRAEHECVQLTHQGFEPHFGTAWRTAPVGARSPTARTTRCMRYRFCTVTRERESSSRKKSARKTVRSWTANCGSIRRSSRCP